MTPYGRELLMVSSSFPSPMTAAKYDDRLATISTRWPLASSAARVTSLTRLNLRTALQIMKRYM